MSAPDPPIAAAPSRIERALRLFTDVRPGEGRIALLLLLNVLLLLTAYYMIKPLREGWLAGSMIQGISKMELKAYSSFGQSLVLVGLMIWYGALVGRWPRRVLLERTTWFCAAMLVMFWILQPDFVVGNIPGMGIAFYLWVGMFGVFAIAQFWAFAADLFDDDAGRRLLPMVAIGATGGAVVGSWITERLITSGFPTEHLLLAANLPLLAALTLSLRVVLLHPSSSGAPAREERGAPEGGGSLGLILGSGTLLGIAVLTLLLSWVNTNGENILFRIVQEVLEGDLAALQLAPDALRQELRLRTTLFYTDFFFWVNLIALFLQAFVASRLLRYGGFATIFLLAPAVAFMSYSAIAWLALLPVVKAAKVAENATDYSLSNTARHVFWLPFPRHVTFKAKPTVDSLFARLGDGGAAFTVLLGTHLLAWELRGYLAVNLILIAIWGACAAWLAHRRRGITEDARRGGMPAPRAASS